MIKFTRPFSDKPIFLNPPFDAVYEGNETAPGDAKGDINWTEATIIYLNGNRFAVKETIEEVMLEYIDA